MSKFGLSSDPVKLIGSMVSFHQGVTLSAETLAGNVVLRFHYLSIHDKELSDMKFDGMMMLTYKCKDEYGDTYDATALLGVTGNKWSDVAEEANVRGRFVTSIITMLGRELGVTILSYKLKVFRNLVCDKNNNIRKVYSHCREHLLFKVKTTIGTRHQWSIGQYLKSDGLLDMESDRAVAKLCSYLLNNIKFEVI